MRSRFLPVVVKLSVACVWTSNGYAQHTSGEWTYTLNDSSEATVTGYSGPGGAVTIPSTIDGNPVTQVGNGWPPIFGEGNTNINSVIIPDGVTSIGSRAFYSSSLASVAIPSGVTNIGDFAFAYSYSLTNASLPETLISIGQEAFNSCPVRNMTLPRELRYIGDYAFFSSGIRNVALSSNVVLGASVFMESAVENVSVEGSGSTVVSGGAFWWCWALTNVVIGEGVIAIDGGAFNGCDNLAALTLGKDVQSIGPYAFFGSKALNSLSLPDGIQTIGARAFGGSSLTNLTIPDSVQTIGEGCFAWCRSLRTVAIGRGTRLIETRAFMTCPALTNIVVDSLNTFYRSEDGVLLSKDGTSLFQYPSGKAGHYGIPQGVVVVGQDSFAGSAVNSLAIPNTVTTIAEGAFAECSSLKQVSMPDSITNIGTFAFAFSGLTNVLLSGGITEISMGMFQQATNLSKVVMKSGITNINLGAFMGCSDLKAVVIPSGVSSVGASAFSSCTTLAGVLFEGNRPSNTASGVFDATPATIFYLAGTEGWEPTFAGRPTALFDPNLAILYTANVITNPPSDWNLYSRAQYEENRLAGQRDVSTNPSAFNLFTRQQFDSNRAHGQQDVVSSPMTYGLYDSNSIMDLHMNGLMVQKQGGNAVVTFQTQTTTDLTQPFTNNGTPITNRVPMPGNKGFLRIHAGSQPTPAPPPPPLPGGGGGGGGGGSGGGGLFSP